MGGPAARHQGDVGPLIRFRFQHSGGLARCAQSICPLLDGVDHRWPVLGKADHWQGEGDNQGDHSHGSKFRAGANVSHAKLSGLGKPLLIVDVGVHDTAIFICPERH